MAISAQPRLREKEFSVGVHGGVTASTVLFQPSVANMTPITNACVLGGNGGLVFRYAGHKYCAFQMELNYLHRGWAEKSGEDRYQRSLHYLEMPIYMHLNFGSDLCRWFLNIGPQIGYCIKDDGYQGTKVNGINAPEYGEIDHRFDWGLSAGTGFYIRSRRAGTYQLEIRYNYSFGGVFGTALTDHYRMASPMELSVNLGYLWQIKSKAQREKDRALREAKRARKAERREQKAKEMEYR